MENTTHIETEEKKETSGQAIRREIFDILADLVKLIMSTVNTAHILFDLIKDVFDIIRELIASFRNNRNKKNAPEALA